MTDCLSLLCKPHPLTGCLPGQVFLSTRVSASMGLIRTLVNKGYLLFCGLLVFFRLADVAKTFVYLVFSLAGKVSTF